jgi:glycosyltransferase involved in cell wall biosynthesis
MNHPNGIRAPITLSDQQADLGEGPDVSFIITCFNEEDIIGATIPQFINAFHREGYRIEIVAVDNGSHDQTGEIIDQLAAEGLPVIRHRIDVNHGYGNGIIQAIPVCNAPLVGFIPADLQIDPLDAVKLYSAAANSRTQKIFKIRRRFRFEGVLRRIVSHSYNLLFNAVFGDLGTVDINGNPKIIDAHVLRKMNVQSKDWFIDAEIIIKAKAMGLSVYELNAFSQMRPGGTSHVRPSTCWEFLSNLWKYRFTASKQMLEVMAETESGHGQSTAVEMASQARSN